MIIDFHTHCFPGKIAEKTLMHLADKAGGLEYFHNGTIEGAKENMKKTGVDKAVVLNIATNEKQQKNVNDFAVSLNNGEDIFAFGSVFPDAEDALFELERIKDMGLKGIKFHPDYQGFFVDDPKMEKIYKKISQLGLITSFHAGFDYGFEPPYGCTPERMERALAWFDSPVIAAHWGGLNMGEAVIKYLCGKDIYFDTSFGYASMPKCYAQTIIEKHGADKIVFGTDSPWRTADIEKRLLLSLEISEDEMDKITHKNAQKLLGI